MGAGGDAGLGRGWLAGHAHYLCACAGMRADPVAPAPPRGLTQRAVGRQLGGATDAA